MQWQKIKTIWSQFQWNRLYFYYICTLLNLIFAVFAGFTMVVQNLWYLFYFVLPIGFGILGVLIFTRWLFYLRIFFIAVIFIGFFSLLLLLDKWNPVFTIGFSVVNVIALCFQYFDRLKYSSQTRTISKPNSESTA